MKFKDKTYNDNSIITKRKLKYYKDCTNHILVDQNYYYNIMSLKNKIDIVKIRTNVLGHGFNRRGERIRE
jgi:hypothetical protein